MEKYIEIISTNAINILLALLFLFLGFKLINLFSRLLKKTYKNKITNDSVYFLFQLGEITLKAALLISLIAFLGIPTTSFVAILGSLGLAVGLSLQGSFANFAGGFLLLTLKPFQSGDYITGAGHTGTVQEIQIFYTKLITLDNKVVTIPNSQLSNDSIINFSSKPIRRLDLTIPVSYKEDFKHVEKVMLKVVNNYPGVRKDPPPSIRLGEWTENVLNIVAWVWIEQGTYYQVYFDLLERFKIEFDKEGIDIPFRRAEAKKGE